MDLNEGFQNVGDAVNQYLGDVSTATAPGASNDLLGFIMENLQKFGERQGESSKRLSTVLSQMQEGKVEPDLLQQVLDEGRNLGSVAGVLGPIGRGASKAANQAQKHMAKALYRADPELIAAAQSDPRMLMFHGKGADQGALASFRETMGGQGGEILANPSLLQGSGGNVWANVPEVLRHEATHFLRRPSMATAYSGVHTPAQIQEMIKTIEPYLGPVAIGGIRKGINRTGNAAVGLDEALAYLSSPMTRSVENPEAGKRLAELLKVRAAGPGATRGVGLSPSSLKMAVQQADPQEQGLMDYIMKAFGGR